MKDFLAKNLPKIKMNAHQGTYLCWLDFRGTGLSPDEIDKKMETEAKIVTDMGHKFGEGGAGFMRFNLACHRSTLEEAMQRLKKAFA